MGRNVRGAKRERADQRRQAAKLPESDEAVVLDKVKSKIKYSMLDSFLKSKVPMSMESTEIESTVNNNYGGRR